MNYRDQQGADKLYRKLVELEEKYGGRFKPDAGWNFNKEPQLSVVREYASNEL